MSDPNNPTFGKADWLLLNPAQRETLQALNAMTERTQPPFRTNEWEDSGVFGQGFESPIRLRARIVGQATPGLSPWYAFSQQTFLHGASITLGSWTFSYGGGFSDSTTFNAYELNGNVNVPVGSDSAGTGALVWLYPMEDGLSWEFMYEGVGNESVQINSSSATTVPLLPTMNFIAGTGITLTLTDDTANGKTDLTINGSSTLGASSVTVRDLHGNSVPNVATVTFRELGEVTTTVSGSGGAATVTVNAPAAGSDSFSGFRFPSLTAHNFAPATSGNCTWTTTPGTNFTNGGYDPDTYLNAGNQTQAILPQNGYYHLDVTTLWTSYGSGGATGYDITVTVNTSGGGGTIITQNFYKTTPPAAADDNTVCAAVSQDFQGAAGDTITVQVRNDNNDGTAALNDGCWTMHLIRKS